MARTERNTAKLLAAALLALIVVVAGSVAFLSKGLPERVGETLKYPATDLKFAFGSGHPDADRMFVDQFADGYALLTSGPVSIQAEEQRVLIYTWLPPELLQEAAFFWRRGDDAQNVLRTDITIAGTQQIDLNTEADWKGEITEFGFLIAGVNGKAVEIGEAILLPDSLNTRIQLSWRTWTTFEVWSQKSVNFLYGGEFRQVIALATLVTTWLLVTLLLFWLFTRTGKRISSRQLLITAGWVSLFAWVVLDIRWSANNIRQIQLSFQTQWQADEQQRSSIDLDGEVYQFMQRLKSGVLGDQPARILVLGDDSTHEYYLLRAKYHLLPHSVDVVGRLSKKLAPESLDYVIFFGQSGGITRVRGWNPSWQKSLVAIDRGEWGVAYRVE